MDTDELLDLVYESDPNQISANLSLGGRSWGTIRENLRQVKGENEDDEAEWYIEAEQSGTLSVSFAAEYENYVFEGVITGIKEQLDYF